MLHDNEWEFVKVLKTVEVARGELDDAYVCSGGMDDEEGEEAAEEDEEEQDSGGLDRDVQDQDMQASSVSACSDAADVDKPLAQHQRAHTTSGADAEEGKRERAKGHEGGDGGDGGDRGRSMSMTQRGCWLTLREAVVFLSQLSTLSLRGQEEASHARQVTHANTARDASGAENASSSSPGSQSLSSASQFMSAAEYGEVGQCILRVIFSSQHNGLVEVSAGALRVLSTALLAVGACRGSKGHGGHSRGEEEESGQRLGTGLELTLAWLSGLLRKVADDSVEISRKSSQVSLAITALLAADVQEGGGGGQFYRTALPHLIAAAAPRVRARTHTHDAELSRGLGEQGHVNDMTRVRAMMALRAVLADWRCGDTAMRLHGDQVLCCILSALQSHAWSVRNAATLALGATVERTVGRAGGGQAGRPGISDLCLAFPSFARDLVALLEEDEEEEGDEGVGEKTRAEARNRSSRDGARLAALCFITRLAPGKEGEDVVAVGDDGDGSSGSGRLTDAVGSACQKLCWHTNAAIREAAARAVLCVGTGQGKLRSVGRKMKSIRDARGCVELAIAIHSSILGSGSGSGSSSRAGDLGGAEAAREEEGQFGWRDTDENRMQSLLDQLLLRLERGLPAREEREDKDAMDLVGIKVAECVVVAFREGSRGAGSLTWSSKSVLVRVASRLLLCAGAEGTRGRETLLSAAGNVQHWLCREIKESAQLCKDGAAAPHVRAEGKHVLFYAAARLCMQAAGAGKPQEAATSSEQDGDEDSCEWRARRQILLRLVGREGGGGGGRWHANSAR